MAKMVGACAFMEDNPACPPSERYKVAYCSKEVEGKRGNPFVGVSVDGLRWRLFEEPAWSVVAWNPDREAYVGFFRHWAAGRRQVWRSETRDFSRWPDPVPFLTSDPMMPPDVDFYCNGYHAWPGANDAHVMFVTCYARTSDALHVELRVSRDLIIWHAVDRRPLVDPAALGGHFSGGVYAGHGLLVNEARGTWSLPLGVPEITHNQGRTPGKRTGKVHFARWRETKWWAYALRRLESS
ncbi:MAG: hypothetical protein Kow0069_20360 [Promethearchaeota archaeon]